MESRSGKGYYWTVETSMGQSEGYTIDNLDKKDLNEGENDFERTFITIRDILSEVESLCMDNEEERLQLCQVVARQIDRTKKRIYKD